MWIRKGVIKVNSKKSGEWYKLNIGDEVEIPDEILGKQDKSALLSIKEKKIKKLTRDEIQSFILFENENWIVFDKPAGIVVHEGNNHWKDLSMNDYLETYLSDLKTGTFKPSFGYRLDKDTSWVLIGAENYEALQYLNRIIRDREIEKYYLAIVVGNSPKKMMIEKKLEKIVDQKFGRAKVVVNWKTGQEAKSEVETIKTIYDKELGQVSLVKVKLWTGRMHQIRVHMASEGFPVVGDLLYGNPAVNRKLEKVYGIKRQLLHCWKYGFVDLDGEMIEFEAKMPIEFEKLFGQNVI